MKGFKNRKEFEQWAFDQFDKHNIPQPSTYTEQELIDLNPGVPVSFIKQHVKQRDNQ